MSTASSPPPQPPRPAGPSTPPPGPGPRPPAPAPGPKPSGPKHAAEALLPVSEVAALFRCSPDHVYRLIAQGRLRTVPLGIGRAKTRIPESAVAEFVAAAAGTAKRRSS